MKTLKILVTACFLMGSEVARGSDENTLSPDRFSWSGFIQQSWVRTTPGVRLSGPSDRASGSFERVETGLAATYQVNEYIDLRGMASIIVDGKTDSQPRINYGLIDIHTDDSRYGVRIGRYSYAYGFYNAARNNPAYRDMELPPQGLYRDGFRYMTRSGDGAQFYTQLPIDQTHTVEIDAGIGKPVLYPQQDIVQTFVQNKDAGHFTSDSAVKSFNISYSNRDHGVVIKYGFLLMDYRFSTPYVDNSAPFPMRVKNHYIGIRKYFDFGDLTLEYMQSKMGHTKWDDLQPLPGYEWGGVAGSSITYKHYLTECTNLIVGYDWWYVNMDDKHGQKMSDITFGYVNPAPLFHESLNLGLVHHINKFTIKGEFHHVHGTNTIRAESNQIGSYSTPGRYNIGIVSVTYKF